MLPLTLLGLLLSAPAGAKEYPTPIYADSEEDLRSLYTDGLLDESDLETLIELLNDPVDVNRASRGELYDLPGVSLALARAIVRDRRRNGPYLSLADLLRVPGMTQVILDQIRPFAEARPVRAVKEVVRGKVRARSIANFEPVTEHSTSHSPEELGYGHWPDTYLSVRAEDKRRWKAGFLGLAREGISWMEYVPGQQTVYARYASPVLEFGKAFVSRDAGAWEAVLGSYTAGFGLGMTFDDTNRTLPHGFYEDLTVSGTDSLSLRKGLFGAAWRLRRAAIGGNAALDATLFASSWWYDAYQYSLGTWDGTEVDPLVDELSTPRVELWVDDHWEQASYLTFPNAYREDVLGGNATLVLGSGGSVGLTTYVGHMDLGAFPGVTGPDQLVQLQDYPDADWYGAVGLDAAWDLGLVDLRADAAHSFTGGNGGLVEAIGDLGVGELVGSLRWYGTDFDNPHARGLAAADEYGGMRDRDERGARLKGLVSPLDWLNLRFMGDVWQRMSLGGTWNAELYGRVQVSRWEAVRISLFADHKNRDLAKNGRQMEYGGESWAERYGDTYGAGDPSLLESQEAPDYESYAGEAGAKNYWGVQLDSAALPHLKLSALYKRTYEDAGYLYPVSDGGAAPSHCDYWFQVSHYGWFKLRAALSERTVLSARLRYEDEDAYGDKGQRWVESYLQWDQKLPHKLKFSLRGTWGRVLDEEAAWWQDWCEAGCERDYDDPDVCDCGFAQVEEGDALPSTFGQLRATVEWRF